MFFGGQGALAKKCTRSFYENAEVMGSSFHSMADQRSRHRSAIVPARQANI